MNNLFDRVLNFVKESNESNSTNYKIEVLHRYPDLKKFLHYVYDPMKKYYITGKLLAKKVKDDVEHNEYSSIFDLLDDLAARTLSGHSAIKSVQVFIESVGEQYRELITNVIDRNLKNRMTGKIINKVFPNTVFEFAIQLAKNYPDYMHKVDFEKDSWFWSRKLDGVRCITIIDKDLNAKFYSRKGNEFFTLKKVKDDLQILIDKKEDFIRQNGLVLDGEIIRIEENGLESLQGVMSEITRKDYEMENPRYFIFDVLTLDEFGQKTPSPSFANRISERWNFIDGMYRTFTLDQDPVNNKEEITKIIENCISFDWEGAILRKDAVYEGKRSNNILKVKTFVTDEYRVVGVKSSIQRVVMTEGGGCEEELFFDMEEENKPTVVEEEMVASLQIIHKGTEISVGSGLSLAQKRAFYKDPSLIIGKVITVQFLHESTNKKDSTVKLNIPTIKVIHGDEREV